MRKGAEGDHNEDGGFTLLELLIAMTCLALVMALLYGGLTFANKAWERSEAHSAGTDDIRLAQGLMRREMEGIYPLFLTDDARAHVDFDGEPQSVSFLGPAPAGLGGPGWARMTFNAIAFKGRTTLAVKAIPELAWNGGPSPDPEPLIGGLKSIEFAYFGVAAPGQPSQWHDRWVDAQRLPLLIRVRVAFDKGDARVWPELIVAPKLSADVACVFDVLSHYCQGRS